MRQYKAIAIAVSTGGLDALGTLLPELPPDAPMAVIIVTHRAASADGFLATHLDALSQIPVKDADYGEAIRAGTAYLAPGGYHLHVEPDRTLRLSVDPPIAFCRPAADLLFESAAEVYAGDLVGVVLTGQNTDGAAGLRRIQARGGLTVVQNPETARAAGMPRAAIDSVNPDHVLDLDEVGPFLAQLCRAADQRRDQATKTGQGTRR